MSHCLVVARSPHVSDPKSPVLFGPDIPSQDTDTVLALLEAPVISGQDPSDSATGRALWGLREDSLDQLHAPPHGQGQSDSSQRVPKARDPPPIQGRTQVR